MKVSRTEVSARLPPREFVKDTSFVDRTFFSPWRVSMVLLGCAAAVALGLWLLRGAVNAESRLYSVLAISLFGGGGALIIVALALRTPSSRATSLLRVDSAGITWIANGGIAFFNRTFTTMVLWPNVAGMRVVNARELPFAQKWNAQNRAQPAPMRLPDIAFQYVGITPKDLEPVLASMESTWKRSVMRRVFSQVGMLLAGPVEGFSAQELLNILESYRAAST